MKKVVVLASLLVVIGVQSYLELSPGGKAVEKRLFNSVGLAQLERAYDPKPGSKTVFAPNPSKTVAWVDADRSGGVGIGDGPDDNWSSDYPRGGIVGFADGSAMGFSHLEIRGSGGVVTITP